MCSSLCLFAGGLLVSYKSFDTYRKLLEEKSIKNSLKISQWVGRNIQEKIHFLESTVSYLDMSSVEMLKSLNVRYFSYAYQEGGKWKIQWKNISEASTQKVINELSGISLTPYSTTKRSWAFDPKGHLVLISPVEVAGSQELKSGFLIFGLSQNFLRSVTDDQASIRLFTLKGESLDKKNSLNPESVKKLAQTRESETFQWLNKKFSPHFSQFSQIYILRFQGQEVFSFWGSSFLNYFFICFMWVFALMVFIFKKWVVEEKIPDESLLGSMGSHTSEDGTLSPDKEEQRSVESMEEDVPLTPDLPKSMGEEEDHFVDSFRLQNLDLTETKENDNFSLGQGRTSQVQAEVSKISPHQSESLEKDSKQMQSGRSPVTESSVRGPWGGKGDSIQEPHEESFELKIRLPKTNDKGVDHGKF